MLRGLALAALALPGWRFRRGRRRRRGEPVDLELVLLADATGSIDDVRDRGCSGRAMPTAMVDPQVLWAIDNGGEHGRIAVAYVEWAARGRQDVVVDWMVVEDAAAARDFGARLLAAPRRAFGTNAIGAALLKGLALIEGNPSRAGAR